MDEERKAHNSGSSQRLLSHEMYRPEIDAEIPSGSSFAHDDSGAEFNLPDTEVANIIHDEFKRIEAAGVGPLHAFMVKNARHITADDDDHFNIVDQHTRKKWMLPPTLMPDFYALCDQMRRNNQSHGMSTRQRDVARMFLDFDFVL